MFNTGDWEFMKHKPEYANAIRKAVLLYERQEAEKKGICPDCGGEIKIRNPTGNCDHLYYPEYKKVTGNHPLPKEVKV